MIKHIVFLKFQNGVSENDIQDFEKSLNALPDLIDEIKHFEFGRDVVRSERSFDMALIVDFDNLEAGERYQKHPEHVKVIEKVKAICSEVKAVDYQF